MLTHRPGSPRRELTVKDLGGIGAVLLAAVLVGCGTPQPPAVANKDGVRVSVGVAPGKTVECLAATKKERILLHDFKNPGSAAIVLSYVFYPPASDSIALIDCDNASPHMQWAAPIQP